MPMQALSDVHLPCVYCAWTTLRCLPCASMQEVGKLVQKSSSTLLVWVPPCCGYGLWLHMRCTPQGLSQAGGNLLWHG